MRPVAAGRDPRLIPRPRLLQRLAGRWKVAVLSAPAGFGKTTLARQIIASRSALWCHAAEEDRDPAHLFGTLLGGAARTRPPCCGRTARLFASRRDMERDGGLLTASLLHELTPARGERVVVIEDLHALAGGREALAWLRRVIEESDPRVRFLVTCRGECPLPLARFEARGEAGVLRGDDLAFTRDEQTRLMRAAFGLALDAPAHDALRDALGGWAAGLALAAQHLRRTGQTPRIPGMRPAEAEPHGRRTFDFLAEEVFAPLPAAHRRALCVAALADDLEPSALRVVLGPGAAALAREIARPDLFVQVPPDGSPPRFHPLFREFLRARAGESVPTAERRRILGRLAAHWRARGETVRAIRALVAAGDHAAAVRLFESVASRAAGGPGSLSLGPVALDLERSAPRDAGSALSPWIVLHRAYAAGEAGEDERAVPLAREAQAGFVRAGAFAAAARGFALETRIAIQGARVRDAITQGEALRRRLPARERAARAIVGSALGELWLNAGEPRRALAALEATRQELRGLHRPVEQAELGVIEATVRFTEGRWDVYLEIVQQALPVFRRAGYGRRVLSLLLNMAEACTYLGEEERAVAHLDEARSLLDAEGSAAQRTLECERRARAASEAGAMALAARRFREARSAARSSGRAADPLRLSVWEGIFERRRGRLPAAAAHLDRAIEGFARLDLPSWQVLARMERALVTGLQGRTAEALTAMGAAARDTRRLGDVKELARNALFEARIRQVAGQEFRPALTRALRMLARENYWVLLRKEADVAAPLLAAARSDPTLAPRIERAWPALPDRLRAQIVAAAPRSQAGLRSRRASGRAPGAPVSIRLLGGFEVRDGAGRRVTFARHAAETLVAHLALHRQRSLPRERLAEALWPDAPAAASRNRFDVTLNAARRALEPDADSRGPFGILLLEGGMCRLAPERVRVDVEVFERLARECEPLLARSPRSPWNPGGRDSRAGSATSMAALERALEAWGGELLPGRHGADWIETERARLAARHRRLALGLGSLALALRRPERAVECATRVLAEDPLEEEALRLAMRALAARGETAGALAVHREFAARLARELDATPSPETEALAAELSGSTSGAR